GAPVGVRSGGLRPRAVYGVRVRRRHRARGAAQVRRRRYPSLLRERPALPGAVRVMKVLVSWLREFVDVTVSPEQLGHTLSMRGFELSSVEPVEKGAVPLLTEEGVRPLFPDAVLDFEILANRPDC